MDYLKLLERSYECSKEFHGGCPPESRLEYLGDLIFDFTTYASDKAELFASVAIAVCNAITEKITHEFIQSSEQNHVWYLVMCNMPFFEHRLNWGTSIRGAWWDTYDSSRPGESKHFILRSTGLWDENKNQIEELDLNGPEWVKFMRALVQFALPEIQAAQETEST